MAEPRVVVSGLWKKFRRGELHDSLRDLIPALSRRLFGGAKRDELSARDFWALRDVSFEVKPGEALGIIGPNGAGKSTILKILNRLLRPTRGHLEIRGRVGALIETAAGFLQGAIMGMDKTEIARKFDAIVEFSGIADFLDTPVKRYSSGMNARLGFAIAAHLDPDVLLIDEVLAIGDYVFQKKAFDRLGAMARSGLPVVVVSHQLEAIASLCSKVILLDRGAVAVEAEPARAIAAYLDRAVQPRGTIADGSPVLIRSVTALPGTVVESGTRLEFLVGGEALPPGPSGLHAVWLRLRSLNSGEFMSNVGTVHFGIRLPEEGAFHLRFSLQLNVQPGLYRVESVVWDHRSDEIVAEGPAVGVEVHGGPTFWGWVQTNPTVTLSRHPGPEMAAPGAAKSAA
jgi:ABC-type polysaccharide/polyol phosphate transport system ATPase subunit